MSCAGAQYLSRESESLVLEGYRRWCRGVITGDQKHWQVAQKLFSSVLGHKESKLASDALMTFTQTLGLCANCPLRTSPVGCPSLCRDEVMVLGLLSGIQHDEQTTIMLCLDGLVKPARCEEALVAAETLASIMNTLGKKLMPVPSATIKAILTENNSTPTLQ